MIAQHGVGAVLTALSGSGPAVQEPSQGVLEILLSLVAFLGGLWLIRSGFDSYRVASIVRNTATEPARSVAMGRTALQGKARSLGEDFDQPFRDGECVYASWAIGEYRGSGENAGWKYERAGNRSDRFLVEDDTGAVVVEDPHDDDPSFPINDEALPTGALAEGMDRSFALVVLSDTHRFETTVDSGEEPPAEIADWCREIGLSPVADSRRRYTQNVIPPGRAVYVFGQATRDETVGGPDHVDNIVLERDGETDLFILSDLARDGVVSKYVTQSPVVIGVALLLGVAGLVGLLVTLGVASL